MLFTSLDKDNSYDKEIFIKNTYTNVNFKRTFPLPKTAWAIPPVEVPAQKLLQPVV